MHSARKQFCSKQYATLLARCIRSGIQCNQVYVPKTKVMTLWGRPVRQNSMLVASARWPAIWVMLVDKSSSCCSLRSTSKVVSGTGSPISAIAVSSNVLQSEKQDYSQNTQIMESCYKSQGPMHRSDLTGQGERITFSQRQTFANDLSKPHGALGPWC